MVAASERSFNDQGRSRPPSASGQGEPGKKARESDPCRSPANFEARSVTTFIPLAIDRRSHRKLLRGNSPESDGSPVDSRHLRCVPDIFITQHYYQASNSDSRKVRLIRSPTAPPGLRDLVLPVLLHRSGHDDERAVAHRERLRLLRLVVADAKRPCRSQGERADHVCHAWLVIGVKADAVQTRPIAVQEAVVVPALRRPRSCA